jgi:uncharacterized membrane protein
MNPNGSQPNDSMQTVESTPNGMNAGHHSVVVNAPTEEVYKRWLRFEDFPQFIGPLRSVQRIDDTHFSFAPLRDGREQRGVIHIVLRIPEQRIAWRTISDDLELGVVSFEPGFNQDTEITLKIRSIFDSPTLSRRLEEYLRNFKRLIENSSQNYPVSKTTTSHIAL